MPPSTTNPLVIVAWILAVFVGLPGLTLFVKAIFFIAEARKDLRTVVQYVHDRRSIDQAQDVTMALVENDINVLQDKTGISRREWPERRFGLADRRSA